MTDLVWIPAQTAVLGSDCHYPEEAPVRQVDVEGFWMMAHQVTNDQFTESSPPPGISRLRNVR